VRIAIALLACLAFSGCGMAKAARETGQTFDKYGCLARDFKSEPPCQAHKPRVDWETREFNQSRNA
jgi:hypothetical protein